MEYADYGGRRGYRDYRGYRDDFYRPSRFDWFRDFFWRRRPYFRYRWDDDDDFFEFDD